MTTDFALMSVLNADAADNKGYLVFQQFYAPSAFSTERFHTTKG